MQRISISMAWHMHRIPIAHIFLRDLVGIQNPIRVLCSRIRNRIHFYVVVADDGVSLSVCVGRHTGITIHANFFQLKSNTCTNSQSKSFLLMLPSHACIRVDSVLCAHVGHVDERDGGTRLDFHFPCLATATASTKVK